MTTHDADAWALVQTCGGCPEQYDLTRNGERVGYFRLRHGGYTVRSPWVDGDVVYVGTPKGDGMFEDDERAYYLRKGVRAVLKHLGVPRSTRKALADEIEAGR